MNTNLFKVQSSETGEYLADATTNRWDAYIGMASWFRTEDEAIQAALDAISNCNWDQIQHWHVIIVPIVSL